MERNKPIFLEFIKIYKNNPCLWDPKDPNYKSREGKKSAYEQLLAVMKKFDPTNPENNIEAVKRKINSMRACFRRDYRKVLNSGNKYKPNLWYYDQLLFVKNYCMKDDFRALYAKRRALLEGTSDTDCSYIEQDENSQSMEDADDEEEIYEVTEIEEHLDESTEVDTKNDKNENSNEKEDDCTTFGKHIGIELQLMTERQRIIAKKLLSDVAYYGRLERLTEFTEITSTKKPLD
ncbi:uncharacterized protein LOC134830803 [Culicoides brevitarsis]|uniref:uncharacterized protein LOC134830803 n=1 Tax=Culicoides brevitarsis TaxID=469753 RepID=UPI00307C0CB3